MTSAEELAREGWTRRFVADEPRLSEAVELYRELGLEVRLEPVEPEAEGESEGCAECLRAASGRLRVIYTRPATRASSSGTSAAPGRS